jgi:hypothetical protein
MQVVEETRRSTLYADVDRGVLRRRYHDTGAWSSPTRAPVDAVGRLLCRGNRRVDRLLAERTYAGAAAATAAPDPTKAPRYLRNALAAICRGPADVETLARSLEVRPGTAWSYAALCLETWPACRSHVEALVHPEVLAGVYAHPDAAGSLRTLLDDLAERAPSIRDVPDCYAHVRTARLCRDATSFL